MISFNCATNFFNKLLYFWKQNKIDLNLTEAEKKLQKEDGVFFMEGDNCQDGMNPKAIEYLNEKRNLITEAGFLFGSTTEEFLKKSCTIIEMTHDDFNTEEYTDFYHPADLLNYFKPYLQIEK
jgi:hypothetical protein